jgi:chemosensory pili system protein ChpA (sensor histidine kinase/response regulator)
MKGNTMNQEIGFSTLSWVKKELDDTLKEARQSLEAHVENPEDEAQLGFVSAYLHQVYGTLQMVELYGASLLAGEMEQVAKVMAGGSVSRHDDACEVLMRAILQLPDYLERLIAGGRDIPLVLLPVMNDLRTVRGENLLSEDFMFSPDLDAELPDSVSNRTNDGDFQKQAPDLRHRFQLGLLGWFRGNNTQDALASMADVLGRLQSISASDHVARLWWVAAGLADALKENALENSASIRRLMGQVDREIKCVADHGEDALAEHVSEELFKNLLFYVGQARAAGQRLAEIQSTYRLKDLLPGEEELAAARESLSGQNADLFETVAIAVKEELSKLKDSLDMVLRNGCKDLKELAPLIVSLRSLGDTLGMLSLDAPRKAVLSRAEDLRQYVDSGEVPPDTLLMDVASILLFVESSVEGMGGDRAVSDSETKPEEQLAESEFKQVLDVVMQEAITDLTRAKEAIVAYIESDSDTEKLGEVPQLFSQVKGGLVLVSETRAAALIDSISRYIESDLLQQKKQAPQHELDSLADAVCGLEYYLEGRREHRMYGGSAMTIAEESVDKLGYPAQEIQPQDVSSESDAVELAGAAGGEAPDAPVVISLADECSDGSEAADGEMPGSTEILGGTELEDESSLDISSHHENEFTESPLEGSADDADDQPAEAEQQQDPGEVEPLSEHAEEFLTAAPSAEHEIEATTGQTEEEDDGLAIIGEEIDEEILEIFIEEAEEEIASINEQLPAWIKDPQNSEALGTIRRSYHTLKGSGRLVGAMRMGEFAWACENLLNRLIDGTVSLSPAIRELLQSASGVLPELLQQIKDGTPTQQPTTHLMQCADALSRGEVMPATEPAEAEPPEEAVQEQRGDAPIESELEVGEAAVPIEQPEVEAPEQVLESAEPGTEEAVYDGIMDQMLYDIFNTETRGHLEVIRQFLNQVAVGEAMVDEPLARAVHTLHGSANMAGADAIADLAGELERWTKALMGAGKALSEDDCKVLEESAGMIEQMLSSLPYELTEPDGYEDLLNRVRSLHEAFPVPSAEETLGELVEDQTCSEFVEVNELQIGTEPVEETTAEGGDPYAECDEELLEIFLEENTVNLETSDSALHRWRESADDGEALAELQRALHTMKGGARMADLTPIGDLAHAVESLIIAIVEGHAGAGDDAMDGLQQAHDSLAHMLDRVRNRMPLEAADMLVARLDELREQSHAVAAEIGQDEPPVTRQQDTEPVAESAGGPEPASEDPYAEADPELLEVFLEEAGDILEHTEQTLQSWKRAPEDQSLMAELQRELHTLKGGARMADITAIGDLAHAVESLMVRVAGGEITVSDPVFAVLEQAHDSLTGMIELVRKHRPLTAASEIVANLESLCEGKEVAVQLKTSKSALTEDESEKSVRAVVVEGKDQHKERRTKARSKQELVRVKANLLDSMVNFAGEVSIYRSRLEQQIGAYRFNLVEMDQTVSRVRDQLRKLEIETEAQVLFRYEKEADMADEDFDPLEMDRYSHMQQLSRSMVESISDLSSIQNLLENITRESETLLLQQSRVNTELQEGLMHTRMVPFVGLAARLRRIVRQTAQELGKKVDLELSGAEGEMDRTVVDRIIAPVEHMLRNAVSHGIEMPEQRRHAGKPEAGTIRITLDRESSDVVLRIADDGAGMNLAAIRSKASERGMMDAGSDLTDNEVLQFVLETGFSTAEKVTQVAGRGVGMDVVNSEVKQLGGSLHIDSEPGKGTSFTVRLPFTLALNQALLVEVGEDTYAIPLSSIEGIVRMRLEDLKVYYDDPATRFSYAGSEYEVRHLGSLLGMGKPRLDSAVKRVPLLLARVGDRGIAFHIEDLLGSREIVVKSVGPQISTVKGVSGATILGDGSVVMILDVVEMLRGGTSLAMTQVRDTIQPPLHTETVTVMVVDDSITVRKVTSRLLERNDMNVITAKDGVDAVSKLQENIPDIMLLDIEMPRMDGFELATHVRNEARLRDIPIIMITSRTGDKHRQRAMQIGVNRYLGKPFQEAELMENIRALREEQNVNG